VIGRLFSLQSSLVIIDATGSTRKFSALYPQIVRRSFIDPFCLDILFFVMDRVHVLCEVGNKVFCIGELDLSCKG
jgi:hypothetical protein